MKGLPAMLTAHSLYNALEAIVADLLSDVGQDRNLIRQRLHAFAEEHDLDLDATATLYRVAAGETHVATVYELTVVD